MNSPAHDIALYLVARGTLPAFGGANDWAANVAAEPKDPDNSVTLYDTGGGEPDTDQLDVFTPFFQVRVRARSWAEGYNKQVAIRLELIAQPIFECLTSTFELLIPSSDILSIGRNEKGLHLLTANYRGRRIEKGD